MSMLTAQVDELRRLAGDGSFEWVYEPIRASVLLEAADTIEGLRARIHEMEEDKTRAKRERTLSDD